MTPNLITIIIADDHEIFRGGLITILEKSKDMKVVAEASNGQQLVQLSERFLPDVILTDLQMQIMNGIEATRIITKKFPAIAILGLSMMGNSYKIADMMNAGANGYLLKEASKDEVIEGIRAVNKNQQYMCSGARRVIATGLASNSAVCGNDFKKLKFTQTEKKIMRYMCEGLSTTEISKRIFLSPKTIENYRAKLLRKTGCKNSAEFAFFIGKNMLI